MNNIKRKNIFDEFLEIPKDPSFKVINFKEFCSTYFFHPGGDAIRLNYHGLNYLKQFLKCHTVECIDMKKQFMPAKHYVFLAKFCRRPYYIGENYITFFDEEEAFLFKLCDGDIDNVKEVSPNSLS